MHWWPNDWLVDFDQWKIVLDRFRVSICGLKSGHLKFQIFNIDFICMKLQMWHKILVKEKKYTCLWFLLCTGNLSNAWKIAGAPYMCVNWLKFISERFCGRCLYQLWPRSFYLELIQKSFWFFCDKSLYRKVNVTMPCVNYYMASVSFAWVCISA